MQIATQIGSRDRQAGFTVVEVMVAMVLSVAVLLGVVQIFNGSRATYQVIEEMSRLQENGRFALDFITRDTRMAGYQGCATLEDNLTNTLNDSADVLFNFGVGIEGYDDVVTPPAELLAAGVSPLPGTDVLIIRGVFSPPVRVVKNNSSAQLFAEVKSNRPGACPDGTDMVSEICERDILLATDCLKSRVFQAGNIQIASGELNITHPASGDPGNAITSWGGQSRPEEEQFAPGSEIVKVGTRIFYVGDNAGVPTLFVRYESGAPVPLVDNVEDFQVLYGRDVTDAGMRLETDEYVTATQASADWDAVVSTRVSLLLRTASDYLATEPQTLQFEGATLAPADRRLRRAFTSVVTIRNRALF